MNSRIAPGPAAFGLMLLLCAIWGMQQVSIKVASTGISPILQAGLRSGVAALLVFAWARWRGIALVAHDRSLKPGLLVGFLFGLEFIFIFAGLDHTTVSRMVVFLYTAPCFTVLGLHFFVPGERMGWRQGTGVLLAFALGWLAHGQSGGAYGLGEAKSRTEQEFVRQAGFAYSVYQPEKRHPVEVAATDQEHLVQWLSKRLGRSLKVPNLEAQGFALVGGRLLPGEAGARAQFMFQNQNAQRITLYLGALEKSAKPASTAQTPDAQNTQATQFRFEADGAVPSFYWAEQGFGYALSGPVDRSTLMALASSVYAQLNRD